MVYYEVMEERGKALYHANFKLQNSSRRWYQHDIDTIIYSDAFRKMQRKAQLLSISDPISRSRLVHTFEVVRIAKEISEKLGINTELTEAIALSHDFGNVAYGKISELFLNEQTQGLFKHEEASALMLKLFASRPVPDAYRNKAKKEIDGDFDNLHTIDIDAFPKQLHVFERKRSCFFICISPEVLDGVEKHGTEQVADTLEGQVVNYADNIAYLIQDINDFQKTGIFTAEDNSRYERLLSDLQEAKKTNYPVSDIVGKTTSIRTAALIERFVDHNKGYRHSTELKTRYSKTLMTDIPVFEIDTITKKAIDRCWEFKSEYYDTEPIKSFNIMVKAKMEMLWSILDDNSEFVEKNSSYRDFGRTLELPIFKSFKKSKKIGDDDWKAWKKAFFIAQLTCDEIDLIIRSFLERDYVFHLSLPSLR